MARQIAVRGTELWPADSRHQYLEKLARIALDEMHQFVAVLDTTGTLLEINRAALEGGGLTREDVEGKPFWETFWWTVSPKAQADLRDAIRRAAAGEEIRYDVEVYGRSGGKETIIMDFSIKPVRDVGGRVVFLLPEGRDITDKKVQEREIARQNSELQALLEEVNALREAAESANRAKDEFLAMLGHELRNPLAPILTALQLIKMRGPEHADQARTVIERQVNHLIRLVDDLLDVSRIARGKVQLKTEIVDVFNIVAQAIEMASPLLEQRAHMLKVEVARGLCVDGDPTRLAQVIANLLMNAAKYTPAAGHITVSAEREHEEVVIRVRDTGIGIPPEVLPRIFDLFVQERQASDRSQGGLGLGLTIVRNLIERHRGTVSAYSGGPGQGSEFVVRLPEARRDGVVARPVSRTSELTAVGPNGSARILVVDDNDDAAQMLSDVLSLRGYDTRIAHDAPEALRIAHDFSPHIAFLDIGLPVMDGYELAAHLRTIPGLANIRLIAVTGYGQDTDRSRSRRAGFHRHLVKPVDIREIESAIDHERDSTAHATPA